MLLPIVIIEQNVNKYLTSGFVQEISDAIDASIAQLNDLSVRLITTLRRVKPKLKKNLTNKNYDVFASQKEKPDEFIQQMMAADQDKLLHQLKSDYRIILINYFTTDKTLKSKIDKFINAVFCGNIPVPQIIQIHVDLIEEFSKQLKLEGRSEESLLDYRLTLIDILAHLCEVYRSSIYK